MYSQIDLNKRKTTLLIIIFTLFILLLGWVFGKITGRGELGLIIAFLISLLMALFGYFKGDKVALWTSGARPIKKEDNPYLYRMVENLCLSAGLPLPRIYLIPDQSINAFACGRNPKKASIAVTRGAIEKLEDEELEGVIAHELSHIKNYDIRLMTLVVVLVGIIILLSDWLLRSFIFGGRRDREKDVGTLFIILGIILAILAPLIAQIIKLAISRKREFLADAQGALLTRYPEGLAKALEKIAQEAQGLKNASPATAHLYISNPFGRSKQFLARLFSTHPPVEERIKSLRQMTI